MIMQKTNSNPEGMNSEKLPYKHSHLFFLFAYVILVCKAMVTCYRIIDFNYLHVSLLFFSGMLLYKLYSIFASNTSIKKYGLLLAFFIILLLILNRDIIVPLWETYIAQNFNSINKGIYYETETYYYQFLPFLVILIPLTTASCIALSMKDAAGFSIIIISIYMFSFWNNGLDKLIASYVPFYIILSLSYYGIIKYYKVVSWYKGTNTKVSVSFKNILSITLFLSISITIASVAASHFIGTKSVFQLKNDYASKQTSLTYRSMKSAFNLAYTGYGSDNGKLGGPVEINTLTALKVKAEHPVYLRGAVKDYYNGQSWSKSTDDYIIKGIRPFLAPDKNFNFYMTGDSNKKPDIKKMSVYNYGLATSTLFAPNNTSSINAAGRKVMYDSSHTFMLAGEYTVNESYTLKYYFSNTGIEYFDKINGINHNFSYETGSADTEKMEYYKNNILKPYKTYLQVPPTITSRTYELVDALTADCRTTEDKVLRIVNYLSSSYPYSLDVSEVPEDMDFVDYFLFNEKRGYCTYFATTATIMLRIAGIPSRYVEGFNMDEEKDSDGLYIVRNHRAHAWTEILISPESNLWCIVDCVPQGASVNEISESSQYRDRFDDDRYKAIDNRFDNLELEASNNNYIQDYAALIPMLLYPLFIIPAFALLLLFIYAIYSIIKLHIATAKLLKTKSMIPLYKHFVTRLNSMGVCFPEESCELEHARSFKDKVLSEHLEKIVTACYEEHYGSIDNHSTIDKKAINRVIERYMRKKQGFFKYWYFRIRCPK